MSQTISFSQLKGFLLHVVLPVIAFLVTAAIDLRALLPEAAFAPLRFVVIVRFVVGRFITGESPPPEKLC